MDKQVAHPTDSIYACARRIIIPPVLCLLQAANQILFLLLHIRFSPYNYRMIYIWLIVLIGLNTCWLGLVVFALPGNWLIVISTALFAWWRWDDGVFSIYVLIAITLLAVLGEVVEFLGGAGGAKKAGAGWLGMFGALGGAVTGAVVGTFLIPIPFLGTLTGACVGGGLGAWGLEIMGGKKMEESVRSGVGAGIGVLFGTTVKFAIGVIIWFTVTVAAFWP